MFTPREGVIYTTTTNKYSGTKLITNNNTGAECSPAMKDISENPTDMLPSNVLKYTKKKMIPAAAFLSSYFLGGGGGHT